MSTRARRLFALLALAGLSLVALTVPPAAVAGEKPAADRKAAADKKEVAEEEPAAGEPAAAREKGEAAGKAKADPNRPEELKPLDRWVGRWNLEMTAKGQWFPTEVKSKFETNIAWDLHNRFLRCEAKGKSKRGDAQMDDAFLWLCTYEPQRGEYRSWVFWSAAGADDAPAGMWGAATVATGTWDEAAKTLTTKSEDKEAGVTFLGVTRWIDNDHHEFTNTFKDASGEVMMEQKGKATRKK